MPACQFARACRMPQSGTGHAFTRHFLGHVRIAFHILTTISLAHSSTISFTLISWKLEHFLRLGRATGHVCYVARLECVHWSGCLALRPPRQTTSNPSVSTPKCESSYNKWKTMTAKLLHQQSNCTIEEALSELEREYQVRERCYDRWIQDGKVSRIDARDRMERLAAAICALQAMQAAGQVPQPAEVAQ
jgi:hypothetical protein